MTSKTKLVAFRPNEATIHTQEREDGLKSDVVFEKIRPQLEVFVYDVQTGKKNARLIHRPVFFG